jgi:MFS family permease
MYGLLRLIVVSLSAASVHSLATPIGSLLSGVFIDAIGRRNSLQLSVIPLCIGWLVIGLSRNVTILLVGRFICGVSVGTMAVPAQVRDIFTKREMMLRRGYSSANGFSRARRSLRRFIDPSCTNNLLERRFVRYRIFR